MSVPRAFTPAPPSAPSVTCPARSEKSRGNTCQTGARRAPRALESVEKVVTTSDNTRCRRPGGHVSARQAATDRWWPFIGFLTTDVYECQLMLYTSVLAEVWSGGAIRAVGAVLWRRW